MAYLGTISLLTGVTSCDVAAPSLVSLKEDFSCRGVKFIESFDILNTDAESLPIDYLRSLFAVFI